MNIATYSIVFALLAEIGSDSLIYTGIIPANFAIGGICMAVALIAKKDEEKSVVIGAGIAKLCGITEHGVYIWCTLCKGMSTYWHFERLICGLLRHITEKKIYILNKTIFLTSTKQLKELKSLLMMKMSL